METNYPEPITIDKDQIAGLSFPENEVLSSPDKIRQRAADIELAMRLGNNYKGKAKIIFEDSTGVHQVETTIWGVTDKRIILKGDLVIPIHRIHKIKM